MAEIRDVTITEESETSLDPGELAALALVELLHANILLIDDRKGYEEAIRRNLHPVGTLAVLAEAATQKLSFTPVRDVIALGQQNVTESAVCDRHAFAEERFVER